MESIKSSFLIILFFSCHNLALSGQSDVCYESSLNFIPSERLVYKVYYNWSFVWVPAGEVYFEVSETDSLIKLNITGLSYPSYDSVFKVRDYYQSIVDKKTGKPICYSRNILEGSYQRFDSIYMNHDEKIVNHYKGKNASELKFSKHELGDCLFDLVSATYNLRNQTKKDIANDLDVAILFDDEKYNIRIDSEGAEIKKVKKWGKLKTLKVSPQLISGTVFQDGDKMSIWVTDDQNKIPVLVESPVFVGSIKAVLYSFENLKYPSVIPTK